MESIHPNDIITMDLNTISYLTLKNGNMVLIDDSVPEKGNKDKMKLPKSTIFGKSEPKLSQKKFKLEITPHSTLFFKGIKINSNKDNIRERYNYKIYNKIIKNESFYFKGIKLNQNTYNFNNIQEKENIPINNHFNMDKTSKLSLNNVINSNIGNNTQINKENEIPQMKNTIYNNNFYNNNINNYNNIQPEYNNQNKIDSNMNMNTNISIPISNSYNNNIDNKMNLNSNNSNNNQKSTRRCKSKIFGFFGKDKKVRISINAVCSLNIKAEDKYKINLINQFNNLVDRLNEEREKDSVKKLLESEKEDKYSKLYPLYKNKAYNDTIKKNFDIFNKNYNNKKDFNSEVNNTQLTNKNSNNFYTKDNFSNFSTRGFNSPNKNIMLSQNRRIFYQPANQIDKLKNKIQRLSTGIVRPSNRLFNI